MLITQAEGQARSLDQGLVAHTDRLRDLLAQAAAVRATEPARAVPVCAAEVRQEPAPTRAAEEPGALRTRVAGLALSGIDVEEISRRLEVPLADVRVLVALEETARARAQAARAGGHERTGKFLRRVGASGG